MQPTSVFASAISRLHADLVVIRLRRAGIARDKISAVFPERLKPNCALCWLDQHSKPTLYNGETVTVAGPMATQLSPQSEPSFIRSLQQIGLSLNDACVYAERLGKGQILVSVSTDDTTEIAIAWHTFRELEADGIALGLSTGPDGDSGWLDRSSAVSTAPRSVPDVPLGVAV